MCNQIKFNAVSVPFFTEVFESITKNGVYKVMFEHWHSPRIRPHTLEACRSFFEDAGFGTSHIAVERESRCCTVDEAFDIYRSDEYHGATIKEGFDIDVSEEFIQTFNKEVKEEFSRRAKDGKVVLDLNRLYYIGEKT